MVNRYLIGTNVLNKYLNDQLIDTISALIECVKIDISVNNRVEILAYSGYSTLQLDQLNSFLSTCLIYAWMSQLF